ncbi:MAG: Fic family protein, partial [Candidatus Tectomicrobia bacterium]|nr:Fic family protein [Candidatus Tectomicrobia bacterium]
MMSAVLKQIDRLKQELDALRPLPKDAVAQVAQKLRLESNYHSNAVEGNSLTLGETRSLILHGLTAHGKPMRDHLDIEGHDEAAKAVEDAVVGQQGLTEAFIRGLHAILLKEPYQVDAETPDGRSVRRQIEIGAYKSAPNNVRTSTGEIYYFTPPEQVKPAMSDLINWYEAREAGGEHPLVLAATFHYRFVRIHPFDDGNGRMARLLMNMIL